MPNQQNSQLALFSDKGIGAQAVAELWGWMGGYIPHQRKHNVHMEIKLTVFEKKQSVNFRLAVRL